MHDAVPTSMKYYPVRKNLMNHSLICFFQTESPYEICLAFKLSTAHLLRAYKKPQCLLCHSPDFQHPLNLTIQSNSPYFYFVAMKLASFFAIIACTFVAQASSIPNLLADIAKISVDVNNLNKQVVAFPKSGGSLTTALVRLSVFPFGHTC